MPLFSNHQMNYLAAPVSSGPTTIGEAYGGGYYAGKIVQGGITYYLILAPRSSGQSSGKVWKTANTAGPTNTRTLNNGPDASSSMNSSTYPAAQFCEGLSIGGYTDWYMPSRDELEVCFRNLKCEIEDNITDTRPKSAYTYPEGNDISGDTMGRNRNSDPAGSAYTATIPAQTPLTLFKTGGTEAFNAYLYWTSSEYSSTQGWSYRNWGYGSGGTQYWRDKANGDNVRAIRRIVV